MKPIFVVKDRAIDTYGLPFAQSSTAQALRGFSDEINSDITTSAVAKHPDDYDLYTIGEYDEDTGKIIPMQPPQLVARGKDLIQRSEST